jgi:predicted nucleic acid-binding protein
VKLFLDINVVLDVALNRAPFVQDSARLLSAIDQGSAEGFVATHTITTAFYVIAKNQECRAQRQPSRAFLGSSTWFPRIVPT